MRTKRTIVLGSASLLHRAWCLGKVVWVEFQNGIHTGFSIGEDPAVNEGEWIMAQDFKVQGRGIEVAVGETKTNGHKYVEVLCEATGAGPHLGRRFRFRGFINTPENIERTIEALRTLGWRGRKLAPLQKGNLEGIGSKIVMLDIKHDEVERDGRAASFPRVAFINKLAQLDRAAGASLDLSQEEDEFAAILGAMDPADDLPPEEAPSAARARSFGGASRALGSDCSLCGQAQYTTNGGGVTCSNGHTGAQASLRKAAVGA